MKIASVVGSVAPVLGPSWAPTNPANADAATAATAIVRRILSMAILLVCLQELPGTTTTPSGSLPHSHDAVSRLLRSPKHLTYRGP